MMRQPQIATWSAPGWRGAAGAALAIAKTGTVTIAPLVRKAFSDGDDDVRAFALMGLESALARSGLSERVPDELFSDVLALLRAERNVDKAAAILHRFDSAKAVEYFLSEAVFRVESPILHEVLEVLANANASVPSDRLKSAFCVRCPRKPRRRRCRS